MAQPATNPKIEELRGRLKADPKSRFFYQLAEELRRAGQPAEAEQVLRGGLATHPAYLAAWVSLGRVCREQKNDPGAVEALTKALQLDPGNVVAARLLGDAYLSLGDKVEAIKKYKLVYALLPADEELEGIIHGLDRELNPPALDGAQGESPQAVEPAAASPEPPAAPQDSPFARPAEPAAAAEPPPLAPARPEPAAPVQEPRFAEAEESPFDKTQPPFGEASSSLTDEAAAGESETGDDLPMSRTHEESPFEEPAGGYTAAAAQIEMLSGYAIESAPLSAEVPGSFESTESEEPAPSAAPAFEPVESLFGATSGDLAPQEPAAPPASSPAAASADRTGAATDRIDRLERWLGRIRKSEATRV